MTIDTLEKKSWAEIQHQKSPEELAKILEERSKVNLAERIRQIAKEAKDNWKEERDALREKLTEAEQTEIRNTLPWDAWVAQVFDKWASKKTTNNEINWDKKWNWNLFDKIESITSRFWNASEIFEKVSNAKWWFMWNISWIMAAFAYFFSGKLPELPEWVSLSFIKKFEDKVEGNISEKVEWGKDTLKNKDLQYIWGIKALFLLKWEKKDDFTISILNQNEIKTKSFSELKNEYKKWENWIWERLKIFGKWSDKQIHNSLKLIIDNEFFLDKHIWKWNNQWKSWEIWKNLIDLWNIWSWMINNVIKKIDDTSFSMNPMDAMKQLSWINMFDLWVENWKINFWDLSDREWLFKDITTKTLITLIWMPDRLKWTPEEKNRMLSFAENDNEKAFIEKLFEFRLKIINLLSWLFWEDIRWKYNTFFGENWLTMKEILELYLITWWNTDINSINWLEKSAIYLKLWKILWKDPSFRWEYFDKKLIEWIEKWTIPNEVKMVLWSVFWKITDSFILWTTKALKELYEAIPLEWKIWAWLAIWVLLISMIYFKPIAIVWKVAMVSIITTAIISSNAINKQTWKVYTELEIKKIVDDALSQEKNKY